MIRFDLPITGFFLCCFFRLLAIVCFAPILHAQTFGQFGNFTYSETSTAITIVRYPQNLGGSVTVPSSINGKPVTQIGQFAFGSCRYITSLTLPTSVQTLGGGAFDGCSGLTTFTIPSGVGTIEQVAFRGCSGLSTITIPSGVTLIQGNVFEGCSRLTSINVSSQNNHYSSQNGLLFNKANTSLITCPEYKSGAIVLPSTLVNILSGAAVSCTRITTVNIPASVTNIASTFSGCLALTAITVNPANPAFSSSEGMLFNKAGTLLLRCPGGKTGQVVISEGTAVSAGAFQSAVSIEGVTLPASTTIIADSMFYNCQRLRTFILPENVVSIGIGAFALCDALEEIDIPDTVVSIGENAFSSCDKLTRVRLPSQLTAIGKNLFVSCASLNDIVIPAGVVSIGDDAFSNCIGLTKIIIPESVKTIAIRAFFVTGLKTVRIPASVESMGNIAFSICRDLTEIEVAPENAFFRSLDGVLYSKDLRKLIQCPAGKMGIVTVPETVTEIVMNAFSNCAGITGIRFMGNSPSWGSSGGTTPQILYFQGRTGFGAATWNGYTAVNDGLPTPTGSWLVSHDLPYDRDLSMDLNGSGTALLLAYALDLDPNENPGASVPRAVIDGGFLSLTYRARRSDITYVPQTTDNLSGWDSEGIIIGEPDANGFRTARFPLGGGSRFMRLMVNESPPP